MSVRSSSVFQPSAPHRPIRIRVSLLPPFSTGNYLLPVPDSAASIADLKRSLVQVIPAVKELVRDADELCLEIEGFEVLDGPIGMLREEDVICVKLSPGSSTGAGFKPKTTQSPAKRRRHSSSRRSPPLSGPIQKSPVPLDATLTTNVNTTRRAGSGRKRLKTNPAPSNGATVGELPDDTSSDSDSSSGESTLTSSSDSLSESSVSSSSSSSASSSSSSSASSSSASSAEMTKPPEQFPVLLKPISDSTTLVPPGQGNSATKLRNLRRRKKNLIQRKAMAAALESDYRSAAFRLKAGKNGVAGLHGEVEVAGVTAVQPNETPTSVSTIPAQTHVLPKDISNRNKRKGFLKMPKSGIKTVFSADTDSSPADALPEPVVTAKALETLPDGDMGVVTERLETADEPGALPTNLFRTTAQFPWVQRGKKRPRQSEVEEPSTLDYGEPEEEETSPLSRSRASNRGPASGDRASPVSDPMAAVWKAVDAGIDSLPPLQSEGVQALSVGALLAWTSVELNLVTFSPELTVKVGRVEAKSATAISVRRLYRPKQSLAGGVVGEEDEGGEIFNSDAEMDEQEQEESFDLTLQQIKQDSGLYRLISDAPVDV